MIFSGGDDGIIRKWERLQLNAFMYSQETLILPKEEFANEKDSKKKGSPKDIRKGFKKRLTYIKKPAVMMPRKSEPEFSSIGSGKKNLRPGVVSMYYYEDLDLLISGYEDSKIRVWGYNEESITYVPEPSKLPQPDVSGIPPAEVTSRVAGMSLKATFKDHKDAVVGLVCIRSEGRHWLLSSGWDRKIFLWDLVTLSLEDVFKNNTGIRGTEELAADGIILGMDYSAERNEFAYCSADKMAYIRQFSPIGTEMKLVAVLQGHEAEVTQIKWHKTANQWITGSEDRTIRIWPAEGIPCLRIINNDGPVTALCIDAINGCLITGSQDKTIRVFDLEKKDEIVQRNVGHSDEIRNVIHIPSRNQVFIPFNLSMFLLHGTILFESGMHTSRKVKGR